MKRTFLAAMIGGAMIATSTPADAFERYGKKQAEAEPTAEQAPAQPESWLVMAGRGICTPLLEVMPATTPEDVLKLMRSTGMKVGLRYYGPSYAEVYDLDGVAESFPMTNARTNCASVLPAHMVVSRR